MSDSPQLGRALIEQALRESGMHISRHDENPHVTIKNADGKVTGHWYPDGSVKDFNGSLGWISGVPKAGS